MALQGREERKLLKCWCFNLSVTFSAKDLQNIAQIKKGLERDYQNRAYSRHHRLSMLSHLHLWPSSRMYFSIDRIDFLFIFIDSVGTSALCYMFDELVDWTFIRTIE